LKKYEPKGVSTDALEKEIGVNMESIVEPINELLSKQAIELLRQGTQLLYRIADTSSNNELQGSDDQEKVVYSLIKAAGNRGIWLRDIRLKSNMGMNPLNKVIKSMENRKVIKAVKSVAAAKRKVYMLYNLEPDRTVTGGAWYSNDQDFEEEFVSILSQQCHRFLLDRMRIAKKSHPDSLFLQIRKSRTAASLVLEYIDKLQISKVKLAVDDLEKILQSLVFDGLAERSATEDEDGNLIYEYRASEPFIKSTGLMKVPCGVCPVFDDCYDDGDVTPYKCIYFEDWF
jgi:DNA-directed RNA polymerase III subunit RPC6